MDPAIKRGWGRRIAAGGVYRAAMRSTGSHFVKTSGLGWISLMLLASIPWAQRVWALSVMTVLSPSERSDRQRNRASKSLLERSLQMLKLLRRWLPEPERVVVGDNTYAALDFLAVARQLTVTVIARLRLGLPWDDGQQRAMDIASHTAVWFHNGEPPVFIRRVLIRDPQGEYAPVTLLCTDPKPTASHIVSGFVQRWQLEVIFEDARRHLGMETQHLWSDKAIARSTPLLLGLFAWVTRLAHAWYSSQPSLAPRQTAWYVKPLPTFSDALALVRQHLWAVHPTFRTSAHKVDLLKIPQPLYDPLISTLCHAA